MVAPVASMVTATADAIVKVQSRLRSRRQLLSENRVLRRRLQELEEEHIGFFGLEEDLKRLSSAVDYEAPGGGPVQVADVVHIDHRSWLQTLVVYVGEGEAGAQQPVVTSEGLVGRVVVVAGGFAKVQLVTDGAASVGAMIERTRRQGIVHGGEHGTLELDFVPLQADVRVGDAVVSAGIDGVFPRGLPIGKINSVEPGNELFHRIRLTPAVDFGRLDQVYLLEREELAELTPESPDERP
jgi:rod shape-determining protein MreC